MPGLVVMIIAGLVVVPISKRVSPHVLIPTALLFSIAGYIAVAFATDESAVTTLMLAFVSLGIGIGMAETVSNDLVLSSAPAAKAGAASAVSETAYELGAVLGTSILGGILTAFYRATIEVPAGVPAEAAEAARETLAGATVQAEKLGGVVGEELFTAAAHAFDSGVTVTALIGAGLIVIAALIAATTLKTTKSAPAEM